MAHFFFFKRPPLISGHTKFLSRKKEILKMSQELKEGRKCNRPIEKFGN